MRSVGIDTASTGLAAVALVVDGEPTRGVVWKPPNKKDSPATHLQQQYDWLRFTLGIMQPDIIAVEELAVFLSKTVIRAMARHEGVALLAAKQTGAIVVSPIVTQARSIVFKGKGNMSKDDAWVAFKKQYPGLVELPKTSGGTDIMDAYTHALAAPTFLERRK